MDCIAALYAIQATLWKATLVRFGVEESGYWGLCQIPHGSEAEGVCVC
jgi:hypothetical protein